MEPIYPRINAQNFNANEKENVKGKDRLLNPETKVLPKNYQDAFE